MILSSTQVQTMFPLLDAERTPKLYLCQLLLISCVDIPTQGINLTLILDILINIPPMILPTFLHSDMLLLIQDRISLYRHLFLRHIHLYILNLTQKMKHRQIHTSFKNARLFNIRIPINNQQLTLLFFGKA